METETSTEIMKATRRVLCEHGYADLTMQRIADETEMTTAAIHYHFDTKQDLLNAFLDDLIDRFEGQLSCEARDPRERLDTFLNAVFLPAEEGNDAVPVALMELQSQAPFQKEYRERFRELDERMWSTIADAVRDGVDAGYFEESDSESVARFVVTMIHGAHAREVALGENPVETRYVIEDYLEQRLGWTPGGVA